MLYFYNCIYLFLAVPGHPCCKRAFSHCSESGYSCVGQELLTWGLLLMETRALRRAGLVGLAPGLSSCCFWAPELRLRGMWDPPRPGIEPTSRSLAGGFFITKPPHWFFIHYVFSYLNCSRVLAQLKTDGGNPSVADLGWEEIQEVFALVQVQLQFFAS